MSLVAQQSNAPDDVTPVTSVTRNTASLTNAERQRLYRQRQKLKAQTGSTDTITTDTASSTKPQRSKRGGHRSNGSARFQELRRQAEAEIPERLAKIRQLKQIKPSVPYSQDVAEIIIERLKAGESLKSICSTDDMPDESTVRDWANDLAHPFSPLYVRARELGYLKLADELEDLAAGTDLGERRFESGVVQRHRLQVETRKWTLAKMLPRVFGDKLDVTSDHKPIQALPDLELARRAMHWITSLKSQDVVDAEVLPALAETAQDGEEP